MPVFDWTRSNLEWINADGSTSLVYHKEDVDKMDPTKMTLPGWDSSYTSAEIEELIREYNVRGAWSQFGFPCLRY